MQKVFLK